MRILGNVRLKPFFFLRTFKRIPNQNEKLTISESQKALVLIFCRGELEPGARSACRTSAHPIIAEIEDKNHTVMLNISALSKQATNLTSNYRYSLHV